MMLTCSGACKQVVAGCCLLFVQPHGFEGMEAVEVGEVGDAQSVDDCKPACVKAGSAKVITIRTAAQGN